MSRSSSRTDESSNPTPSSDHVSADAPGVRTEAEVVADDQAAADEAANEAPPGVTGSPLVSDEVPDEEDDGKLVHYVRESDGTVQSVNAGSREHRRLEVSREWQQTTRAKARKADVAHSDGFKIRQAKAKS